MTPKYPARGEIWFLSMHTDPPGKGARPALVVSPDGRNQNPRADTLLVIPLSTSLKRSPTHVELAPGETGLSVPSIAKAEEISSVPKRWLLPPRSPLRRIGEMKLKELGAAVQIALGFAPRH